EIPSRAWLCRISSSFFRPATALGGKQDLGVLRCPFSHFTSFAFIWHWNCFNVAIERKTFLM
ncbi:hypothetical protein, partial [Escherichia coli]|uniref:hypothetical protein n=1 Tax=Escherichia coli TaxID=562 RepID=UPI001BC8A830